MDKPAKNTDTVIYRKDLRDPLDPENVYSPRVFITQNDDMGIAVGGMVYVMPVERWHALEAENTELRRVLDMVEWVYKSQMSDWFHEGDVCAWCDGYKEDGHTHDCPRQKALGME